MRVSQIARSRITSPEMSLSLVIFPGVFFLSSFIFLFRGYLLPLLAMELQDLRGVGLDVVCFLCSCCFFVFVVSLVRLVVCLVGPSCRRCAFVFVLVVLVLFSSFFVGSYRPCDIFPVPLFCVSFSVFPHSYLPFPAPKSLDLSFFDLDGRWNTFSFASLSYFSHFIFPFDLICVVTELQMLV
ncbi:unnamed protein product [Polarella glacialis]|uniref:Transmembrane protein n=1 Tax=Polarella glacialis TaxID=89957 RepID=A0A813GKR3_POLGL|nr:unnamed protein product [Polarella glacialis]